MGVTFSFPQSPCPTLVPHLIAALPRGFPQTHQAKEKESGAAGQAANQLEERLAREQRQCLLPGGLQSWVTVGEGWWAEGDPSPTYLGAAGLSGGSSTTLGFGGE